MPPGAPQPVGYVTPPPAGFVYVGFWRRLGAYVIDSIIVAIPVGILEWPLVLQPTINQVISQLKLAQNGQPVSSISFSTLVPWSTLLLVGLFGALISFLYFGLQVAFYDRTIGMRVIGARVARADNGGRIGLDKAVLRSTIFWVPALFGFAPYASTPLGLLVLLAAIWVAFNPRKQGLHDLLAGTVVIRPAPVVWVPTGQAPPAPQ